MSGKAGPRPPGGPGAAAPGGHGPALAEGLGTALNWLTVLPVPGARTFDRVTGRRAMAALPVVGLVVGLVQAAVLLAVTGLAGAGAAPAGLVAALAGLLAVAAAEALTRGMHLDGLADVADALGSYAPPARAREILADPATGPMALGAVALTLPLHAAGLAALAAQQPAGAGAGGLAAAAAPLALPAVLSRAAAMTACRRGWPAAGATGFGALVAGTQPAWSLLAWWAALAAAAYAAAGVAGLAAAGIAAGGALALGRHALGRLGGIGGDVLGAIIELAAAAVAVTLALAA